MVNKATYQPGGGPESPPWRHPIPKKKFIRGSPTKGSLSKIRTKASDSVHTIASRRKGQNEKF